MTVAKGIAELRYLLMETCKVNRYFWQEFSNTLPEIEAIVGFTFIFISDLYQIKHTEVNPSSPLPLALRFFYLKRYWKDLESGMHLISAFTLSIDPSGGIFENFPASGMYNFS